MIFHVLLFWYTVFMCTIAVLLIGCISSILNVNYIWASWQQWPGLLPRVVQWTVSNSEIANFISSSYHRHRFLFSCSSVHSFFYASAQRSGGRRHTVFVLFARASVCATRNIVTMISCRVFDTFSPNLHR